MRIMRLTVKPQLDWKRRCANRTATQLERLCTYITIRLSAVSKAENEISSTSCAKPPVGKSPGEVELVVIPSPVGGGGGAIPPVGMLPASVVLEIANTIVTTIKKRFIGVLL